MTTERKTKEQILKEFDEYLAGIPTPTTSILTHGSAAERNREVRQLLAQQRWEQYQRELPAIRRQQAIDSVWEKTLEARREIDAEEAQSCHVGPCDPDH
jgi:hypothetical protein